MTKPKKGDNVLVLALAAAGLYVLSQRKAGEEPSPPPGEQVVKVQILDLTIS